MAYFNNRQLEYKSLIEAREQEEAQERIRALATRYLEEAEQREKERQEFLKEVYAERDRKIAAIRAGTDPEIIRIRKKYETIRKEIREI